MSSLPFRICITVKHMIIAYALMQKSLTGNAHLHGSPSRMMHILAVDGDGDGDMAGELRISSRVMHVQDVP